MRDFKNYLIRQLEKTGVNVVLNTKATPEMVDAGKYDAVIAGCGAVPKDGEIPGADYDFVWAPIDVFGNEDKLGNAVIVIGGAMSAVDTALYLAQNGHDVTMLTRKPQIAYDKQSFTNDLPWALSSGFMAGNRIADLIEC